MNEIREKMEIYGFVGGKFIIVTTNRYSSDE